MIKKIYKYPLEAIGRQTISLPVLAQPLKVDIQWVGECGGLYEKANIVLWALVNPDPDVAKQDVVIRMIMTGEEIPDADRLHHIGTIKYLPTGFLSNNGIVAHFFIETDR